MLKDCYFDHSLSIMDRKKLKIIEELDSILKEKMSIDDSLQKVINKISSFIKYAQIANTNNKNIRKILSFMFDILLTFINISSELDSLLECEINLNLPDTITNSDLQITPLPFESNSVIPVNSETTFQYTVEENMKEIVTINLIENVNHDDIEENVKIEQLDSEKMDFTIPCSSNEQQWASNVEEIKFCREDDFKFKINNIGLIENDNRDDDSSFKENDSNVLNILPLELPNITLTSKIFDNSLTYNDSFERPKISKDVINTCDEINYKLNERAPVKTENNDYRKNVESANVIHSSITRPALTDAPDSVVPATDCGLRADIATTASSEGNIFYVIPQTKVLKKDQFCCFSAIYSPSNFFIQIADEETSLIDEISDEIRAQYENSLPEFTTKETAFYGIRTYCFVHVNRKEWYNTWYRGEVLNWYLNEEHDNVFVKLLDYGYKTKVNYRNLRKLTKELSLIPALALSCHLRFLFPPKSLYNDKLLQWPKSSVKALKELGGLDVTNEETHFFKICYVQYSKNQRSYGIDLLDEEVNRTVCQILLDLKLAVSIVDEDGDDEDLKMFIQDSDTVGLTDNINEILFGYDPKDEARICRFTRRDGTCFKGKNCKLEHTRLSKDGFTTDKEVINKRLILQSTELPALNDIVMLFITNYINVCRFHAQIVHSARKQNGKYYVDENLYNLLETINSPKLINTYHQFKIPPEIGEVVLVKHWDKKWLRARVVNYSSNADGDPISDIIVFLVDFGGIIQVQINELRKINQDYLNLPFQAIEFCLDNYKINKKCSQETAEKFFMKNIYFHNFIAQTRSVKLPLKINLRSLSDQTVDIGKSLEENGFAVKQSVNLDIADNCFLSLE